MKVRHHFRSSIGGSVALICALGFVGATANTGGTPPIGPPGGP